MLRINVSHKKVRHRGTINSITGAPSHQASATGGGLGPAALIATGPVSILHNLTTKNGHLRSRTLHEKYWQEKQEAKQIVT